MLKLLFKDLGLALEAAAGSSIPMPVVGLVRQIYTEAIVAGKGDDDFSAVAGLAEKLSGVSLKK
jgi:3-hydroxyisobutyrate dehydrogenase-like beta-hydroxyacid dehydrogenase